MKSYLIISPSIDLRKKEADKLLKPFNLKTKLKHPDILRLNPAPSIGIKQIRSLQTFLSRKPYQAKIKIGLILRAENLTLPAQNAFLKTLEEPPENSLIILAATQKDNLLQTILSRCQIIRADQQNQSLKNKDFKNFKILLNNLLKSRAGERLKLIEPYIKNKEQALEFCYKIMLANQKLLHKEKDHNLRKKLLKSLKQWQEAEKLLQQNVNPKLCLNNAVVNLA
jgi:DNA polymerase III delta prime subunit